MLNIAIIAIIEISVIDITYAISIRTPPFGSERNRPAQRRFQSCPDRVSPIVTLYYKP